MIYMVTILRTVMMSKTEMLVSAEIDIKQSWPQSLVY